MICLFDKTIVDQKGLEIVEESLAIVEQSKLPDLLPIITLSFVFDTVFILHESLGVLHDGGDLAKKRPKAVA